MGRESNRLSAAKVAKLTKPGRYADGGNLWLQISANGGKSWLLRYMRGGKARHAGLGPLDIVSLAEARSRAHKARLLLLDGIDPI
ncbi:MAG TPA: Arm DNA-binding domain-containing protein, partial [Hyphomicrobium sp.]|nr:Arm DNA-binding domain-containing protein [Hyphomicrobium sp.]